MYPSQTKIWEGGTKDDLRMFEANFKDVSTQFGPRTFEKSVENPHYIFCSSLPNLRLGGVKWRACESCLSVRASRIKERIKERFVSRTHTTHKMMIACRCVCQTSHESHDDSMPMCPWNSQDVDVSVQHTRWW